MYLAQVGKLIVLLTSFPKHAASITIVYNVFRLMCITIFPPHSILHLAHKVYCWTLFLRFVGVLHEYVSCQHSEDLGSIAASLINVLLPIKRGWRVSW